MTMPYNRWPKEMTKGMTWYLKTDIVWECSTDSGDPGRNDIWDGWVGLVR